MNVFEMTVFTSHVVVVFSLVLYCAASQLLFLSYLSLALSLHSCLLLCFCASCGLGWPVFRWQKRGCLQIVEPLANAADAFLVGVDAGRPASIETNELSLLTRSFCFRVGMLCFPLRFFLTICYTTPYAGHACNQARVSMGYLTQTKRTLRRALLL